MTTPLSVWCFSSQPLPPSLKSCLKLDGANGIGADKMKKLVEHFGGSESGRLLDVKVVNDGSKGELNRNVSIRTWKGENLLSLL